VKPFEIGKRLIAGAWEKVRASKGAPGVDAVSIGLFEQQLKDNLYKLWNRMSSGSYFPVAIHPGRTAAGSQGPVVKSWVSASRASMPHLVAVDR
jgi:hypothetical protein